MVLGATATLVLQRKWDAFLKSGEAHLFDNLKAVEDTNSKGYEQALAAVVQALEGEYELDFPISARAAFTEDMLANSKAQKR